MNLTSTYKIKGRSETLVGTMAERSTLHWNMKLMSKYKKSKEVLEDWWEPALVPTSVSEVALICYVDINLMFSCSGERSAVVPTSVSELPLILHVDVNLMSDGACSAQPWFPPVFQSVL